KAFFQVCAVNASGARQWEQRWPTSAAGIEGFVTRCGVESRVAVEASSPTWAFVDQIVAHVGSVQVVDTRKTRIKAGYAAKTDRLDAQRLADALRRDSVVGIYYPPPAIRDLRELGRYRCHLARLQASVKQRIRALLLRHGVVDAHRVVHATWYRLARPVGAPGVGGQRAARHADRVDRRTPTIGAGADRDPDGGRNRSDRAGVGSAAGVRPGLQCDGPRRSRDDRALPRWAASGQLRRARAARRAQRRSAV